MGAITEPQAIDVGQTIDARLERGQDAIEFFFEGHTGDVVSAGVLAADFDSKLELYSEETPLPLTVDDDSGGNLNPLINGFELQVDGTYRLLLRGYSDAAEGFFRLTVVSGELSSIPTGNTISYGQTITDSLTNNAEVVRTFKGAPGDIITIQVEAAFDSYVQLLDSNGRLLIEDDDAGGNLNPLIEFYELPNDDEYTIVLRGYSANNVGTYSLTLVKSFVIDTTPIAYGETLNARLEANGEIAFIFTGQEGERISVTIQSEIDPRLELRNTLGALLVLDDDSGGNLQPALTDYRLPVDGDYVIVVSGFSEVDAGPFTITLDN
jgi:hypothetical protein